MTWQNVEVVHIVLPHRCRHQQARLSGHTSYSSLTAQRLQAAAGGRLAVTGSSSSRGQQEPSPAHQVGTLIQLQEALEPLCQQEVSCVMGQLSTLHKQQQQPQQHQGGVDHTHLHDPQHQQEQRVAAGGPWDWDYLQHQAQGPLNTALQQHAAKLQQHLQLLGLVAGLSHLLQDMLGLQLLPRAAAEAEVWAPHVLVLDVLQQDVIQQQQPVSCNAAQLLGTVYVDIGGGYGARQLRYARSHTACRGDDSAPHTLSELPAVAIGISGSRLQKQQQQQAQADHEGQQQVAQKSLSGVEDTSRLDGAAGPSELVLSISQLWELGHELGHAVHLVASSRYDS